MIERMVRAAQLDNTLYDEVEHDTALTSQALQIVVLVSALAALGSAIGSLLGGNAAGVIITVIIGILQALIGWAVWSFATYLVGTQLFGGSATYGELLRTIGYAYTPGILAVFSFIPVLGGLLTLIGGIWTLVTGVIAVRQALDFTTGKAIVTILVALIPVFFVVLILSLPLAALQTAAS